MRIKPLSIALAITTACAIPIWSEEVYDVVDLGTLGGASSSASAINDHGVIVGSSVWTNGETHAFIWSNGVMSRLLTQPWITNSSAYDINESGHVVGYANTAGGMLQSFLLAGAVYTNLGVFAGGSFSVARALNDSDQVAGQSHITNAFGTNPHGFRWTDGVMADLRTLDGSGSYSSEAYDIDNAGRVIGFAFYYCPGSCWDPFIWVDTNTNGLREFEEMIALDNLTGDYGLARGINELGQIVGEAATSGFSFVHAFLLTPQNGQWNTDGDYNTPNPYMIDLGTLGGTNSSAAAVNDAGTVVGWSELPNGTNHAYIYDAGLMVDLNDLIATNSGWTLTGASAINSSGHIVGSGTVAGQTHGFLLVPASNRVTLTRIDYTPDSATSDVSLFWSGRGSNLGFTVEMAENTTSATWQVIAPTNQWPIQSLFWAKSATLVSNTAVFRVRAASY